VGQIAEAEGHHPDLHLEVSLAATAIVLLIATEPNIEKDMQTDRVHVNFLENEAADVA
jgi:predicted phage tail protein